MFDHVEVAATPRCGSQPELETDVGEEARLGVDSDARKLLTILANSDAGHTVAGLTVESGLGFGVVTPWLMLFEDWGWVEVRVEPEAARWMDLGLTDKGREIAQSCL